LVAWWPGEGNANDIAGTNNGTLEGGVTFTNGEVGRAFSFDGVSGLITNAMPGLTYIMNSYTTEFWAWPTAARASTPEATSGVTGTSNQRYAIFPTPGGNGFNGSGVSVGTNGVSVFEHAYRYLPSLLVYDAPIVGWTHIAVVYQNQRPTLYVNGLLVRTGLLSTAASYPSTCLGEGGSNVLLPYGYYAGLLDEVSIYNRALSAAEIQAIYKAGSAGKCLGPVITAQPQGQVGYWGRGVTVIVTAGGTSPLSYQWLKDGTPIEGATASSLVMPNLEATNAGNYSVVVTNSYGSTTSSNAYLTVNPAGVSLALYSGITIDGVVGFTYGIQLTTDLSNTNSWAGVTNITLSVPTDIWYDSWPSTFLAGFLTLAFSIHIGFHR
jgi:hypothetical protein